MADKSVNKRFPGIQKAYKKDGFNGVWKLVHGKGITRWIKARNWARARAKQAAHPSKFKHAQRVYEAKAKKLQHDQNHGNPPPNSGDLIVTFDGRPCPGWIVREALQPARDAGVSFTVISGYRTPEYSRELCQGICGADSCPGLCAGVTSNHTCPSSFTCQPHEGAVDVVGAPALIGWCHAHGVPLNGAGQYLPNDVNHCSYSGR